MKDEIISQSDKSGQRKQNCCKFMHSSFDRAGCSGGPSPCTQSQEGVQKTETGIPGTMQVCMKGEKECVTTEID